MRTRLALLAAALAAFGGSLATGFHFDDYAIFQGAALHSPLWSLQQTRPLNYLTFWLNCQAGEAARQDYVRALAIDPGLTEARRNLRSLEP